MGHRSTLTYTCRLWALAALVFAVSACTGEGDLRSSEKESENPTTSAKKRKKEQQVTPKARLLVVDDHAFTRLGLKAILAGDGALEVVGEARDGQEAIACCRELHPDLVLMDVSMPKMNGLEATRQIKAQYPETSVLILTAHADNRLLMDAVKAGAAGYVLKGEHTERVLEAVRAVLEGETPLDQKLAMSLLRRLGEEAGAQEGAQPPAQTSTAEVRDASASLVNPLTPRETEVLSYLASGKTNRQIAQELHLSLSSVKRHLEHILPKLKASDRTQAAVKAIELGLVPYGRRE